jgi:predicted amino acid racemase
MLLGQALKRNPEMVEAAIDLHQRGAIPAATHLVDLDALAENTRAMAESAREHQLRTYIMTKQNGHNPHMAAVALAQGLDSICAVESIAAHIINRYGQPVGHVGHLSNIPKHQVRQIVGMEPEVITVYSYESAKMVSDAAGELGRTQNIYVRVSNPDDEGLLRGMVGGWTLDDCVQHVRRLVELPNVRVSGLTQHCCINYMTQRDPHNAVPTEAFFTMIKAKDKLERELGLEDLRVNCAGNTNAVTFGVLAGYGATDMEPGLALTGSAFFHALLEDMPERPAQLFVTEVTHHWQGEVNTLGGGFAYLETFGGGYENPYRGAVGSSFEEAKDNFVDLVFRGVVDYHGVCTGDVDAAIGDTAVFALHPQFLVERGYTAAVSGISRGEPRVEGIFDCSGHALDEEFKPRPVSEVVDSLDRVAKAYAPAQA